MTSGKQIFGEVVTFARPEPTADFAVVPVRADLVPSGESEFGNVVPFRPRTSEAGRAAPEIVLSADAVRQPVRAGAQRARQGLALALSLAIHGGLLTLLWHEPPPLASIGLEVISVELVLGATAPAGVATAPGENEVQSAAVPEKAIAPEQTEQVEQKATAQPQKVTIAEKETAPEVKTAKAEEPKRFETAAAPERAAQAEPKPPVAMVESPVADTVTAAPREVAPDPAEITLLPQPEERPIEKKPEAKPEQAAPPKPVKNAAPAKEKRRIDAPTRDKPAKEAKASTPTTQANNVGVGRSAVDSNYPGLVSAHLRRHQQYPSDARSRGEQGTASVSFGLDGGGRVTSARLARSSGIASIDGEVQAMVRRASPFPAPPGGRPQSFTVPVNFRLN
jgi:protein TonB